MLDRGAKKSVKWDVFGSATLTHDYSNIGDTVTTTELVPDDEEDEYI